MLNKEGVLMLADDLVANAEMYDQCFYGAETRCGTVCCMAGLCLMRKIGRESFLMLVNRERSALVDLVANPAIDAGRQQLGIGNTRLFGFGKDWPDDLYHEYYETDHASRFIVALKALQRLRDDGTIDPDPNAVHTYLPQLAQFTEKAVPELLPELQEETEPELELVG